MLSFWDRGVRLCDGLSRREWLRVGGLGFGGITGAGLSLEQLLAAERSNVADGLTPRLADGLQGAQFGKAKNVIYLWLQGGPPQHETFDPKPEAPVEIRGPFRPIQTSIPGIQFSELLPRTAKRADKLAVIRSLATDDNNHDVSGYWVLTGYPYGPGSARQIKPTDWPYFGSIVRMLKPSEKLPALTSVWLPDMMRLNDNVTPAGQTGGFLGSMWDPERFVGDPAAASYRIEGLSLATGLSPDRMQHRAGLLNLLDSRFRELEKAGGVSGRTTAVSEGSQWSQLSQLAMNLVTSGQAKEAFDLNRESPEVRDRYGRHTWGQSCLLARRLVEAGVRLVHVNWPREPGDNAVDNPLWDTHAQNADRLQDVLCPLFDNTFAALLDDLETRGLLSETLVVAIGEFGRTPKINRVGGRDHWGPVFSGVLAGAGISGGQVYGASDRNGAYPVADPIRPHDLTATIFHLLGIPHNSVFPDRTNRPQPVTKGEPLYRLLGDQPATDERCVCTGDESFVPPFDDILLVDQDFRAGKILPTGVVSRSKGWRSNPLPSGAGASEAGLRIRFSETVQAGDSAVEPSKSVRLGVWGHRGDRQTKNAASQPSMELVSVSSGEKLLLAQEIRSARGGHYTLRLRLTTGSSSADCFEECFGGPLSCRLVLFRYSSMIKDPLDAEELASEIFRPILSKNGATDEFHVSRFLGSRVPGENFATGNGLGVAIILETHASLEIAPTDYAWIQLTSVNLEFSPRQRDDSVTV